MELDTQGGLTNIFFTRETTFTSSCLPSCISVPSSWKGAYSKKRLNTFWDRFLTGLPPLKAYSFLLINMLSINSLCTSYGPFLLPQLTWLFLPNYISDRGLGPTYHMLQQNLLPDACNLHKLELSKQTRLEEYENLIEEILTKLTYIYLTQ